MADKTRRKNPRLPSKELIAIRIEQLRQERGMSKADLARACNTNEGNLWKWLTAGEGPDELGEPDEVLAPTDQGGTPERQS